MPDENKFKKLRDAGYTIRSVCRFCKHGQWSGNRSWWGTCKKHRYNHLKHDNHADGRGVSIIALGSCPDVEVDESWLYLLEAHGEFLEK